jgi:hypothetical protein
MPLIFCSCAAVGVEKAKYTVLEKEDEFEIRRYDPYLEAVTLVDADFQDAGNIAFRRLFDYISGNNRSAESIAMTAPVNQQPASQKIAMTAPVNQQSVGDRYVVSFVMPSEYTLDTLPQPVDTSVVIKEVPAYKAAAIRYSGTWSQKRYEAKKAALQEFIRKQELSPSGPPIFARYNSPFQFWFLRRNEVIIPIE